MLCVQLRLAVKCPGCDAPVPLNGIFENATCTRCQEVTPLSGRLRWSELLNYQNPLEDIFEGTKGHRPGQGDRGAWSPVNLDTVRAWPQCPCGQTYEESAVLAAAEGGADLTCGGCAATLSVHPAPALLTRPFPQVRAVVGGAVPSGAAAGVAAPGGRESVAITCSGCGGSLQVDGQARTVSCQFCAMSNYLPDELWLRLHPPQRRMPWWIVFDDTADTSGPTGHTLEDLLYMAGSNNYCERAEAAAHPDLPVPELERLAEDEEEEVRHAVVSSGRLPTPALAALLEKETDGDVLEQAEALPLTAPLLHALSLNPDSRAQRFAAGHPLTPEADLLRLVADAHGEVLDVLGGRPLPPAVLHQLAQRSDQSAQLVAAAVPETAAADLTQLAASPHQQVRRQLAKHPSLPESVVFGLAEDDDTAVSTPMKAHPADVQDEQASRRRRFMIAGVVAAVLLCGGAGIGLVLGAALLVFYSGMVG